MKHPKKKDNRIYTVHGEKHMQGVAFQTADGVPALGFQNGNNRIVGFTTVVELTGLLCRADLPVYDTDFIQ